MVNTVTRARYAMMLSREMWDALLQAQDFDAVLETLAQTVYGPYLHIPRQALTPRRVEYQLRWYLADAYGRLIRLTPPPGRQLLAELWRIYEVDNIKAILRGVQAGASWDQVRHLLAPMARHVTVTMEMAERMMQSASVAQAIEVLRDTPYYDPLSHALSQYRSEHRLFPLEIALDLDHYRQLWRRIHAFKGQDYTMAMRLVGTLIDVDNLMWAIRYRTYHHLSEEEIINYTLPFGYRIHDDDIRTIASGTEETLAETIRRIVRRAYPTLEGVDRISLRPRSGLVALEYALQDHLARVCQIAFAGYPFHIGVPIAYLLLVEREIRHLTAWIEWVVTRSTSTHRPPAEISIAQVAMPVWVRDRQAAAAA